MAEDQSREHDEQRKLQRTEQPAAGPEGLLAPDNAPSYPASLLSDPRLSGRGNGPVRTALMLQMQRTYGNRATRRFLQRAKDAATHDTADTDDIGQRIQEGVYNPGSSDGRRLLAHEATHTLQQTAGPVAGKPTDGGVSISDPSDSFEQAADRVAENDTSGVRTSAPRMIAPSASASVQRQTIPTEEGNETNQKQEDDGSMQMTRASDLETPVQRQGMVLQLQAAPNHATTPGPGTTSGTPTSGSNSAPVSSLFVNREVMETIRSRATVRYEYMAAYVGVGARVINTIKAELLLRSERYDNAYKRYAAVVRAGGAEARNQSEWIGIFAGIAIGVGVGLLAEAILPVALTGATLVAAETGGEVVEAIVGGVVTKGIGLTDVAGMDLEPGGLKPEILELQVWKLLERLHNDVLQVARNGNTQFLLNGAAEYAIGELKVRDAHGQTDMPEGDLTRLGMSLIELDRVSRPLDAELPILIGKLKTIETKVSTSERRSAEQMEQDIWIMWMSEVSDSNSNILDLDEIEDHLHHIGVLGSGSRLGVDFGLYTSKDDELEALKAARAEAHRVRDKYTVGT